MECGAEDQVGLVGGAVNPESSGQSDPIPVESASAGMNERATSRISFSLEVPSPTLHVPLDGSSSAPSVEGVGLVYAIMPSA